MSSDLLRDLEKLIEDENQQSNVSRHTDPFYCEVDELRPSSHRPTTVLHSAATGFVVTSSDADGLVLLPSTAMTTSNRPMYVGSRTTVTSVPFTSLRPRRTATTSTTPRLASNGTPAAGPTTISSTARAFRIDAPPFRLPNTFSSATEGPTSTTHPNFAAAVDPSLNGEPMVVVHNLEPKTTQRMLLSIFFPLGAREAHLIPSATNRKVGIVTFPSHEMAELAAQKMDDFVPHGQSHPLSVAFVRNEPKTGNSSEEAVVIESEKEPATNYRCNTGEVKPMTQNSRQVQLVHETSRKCAKELADFLLLQENLPAKLKVAVEIIFVVLFGPQNVEVSDDALQVGDDPLLAAKTTVKGFLNRFLDALQIILGSSPAAHQAVFAAITKTAIDKLVHGSKTREQREGRICCGLICAALFENNVLRGSPFGMASRLLQDAITAAAKDKPLDEELLAGVEAMVTQWSQHNHAVLDDGEEAMRYHRLQEVFRVRLDCVMIPPPAPSSSLRPIVTLRTTNPSEAPMDTLKPRVYTHHQLAVAHDVSLESASSYNSSVGGATSERGGKSKMSSRGGSLSKNHNNSTSLLMTANATLHPASLSSNKDLLASTVYITKLPNTLHNSQLRQLFETFGDINKVRLYDDQHNNKANSSHTNNNNTHRGCFGFVEFSSATSARNMVDYFRNPLAPSSSSTPHGTRGVVDATACAFTQMITTAGLSHDQRSQVSGMRVSYARSTIHDQDNQNDAQYDGGGNKLYECLFGMS